MEGDKFTQAGKLLIGQQTDDKTEEKVFKEQFAKSVFLIFTIQSLH